MQTIFSTADVPQAEAFDYWVDVVRANVTRHEGVPLDRSRFFASLQAARLGDLSIMRRRRAPENGRSGGDDDSHMLLLLPPLGHHYLEFANGTVIDNHSGPVLLDPSAACATRETEALDSTVVRIPRGVLARRIRITRDVVNRPVPLATPGAPDSVADAALLDAFVREIVRIGPSKLSPAAAAIVREQMIDLTAIVLGNLVGAMPRLGAAARFGTLKLRVFIESQLTNPDADARSITAGAGVSESHANRLLALEGTSIRRLLIERRLNKCREMIEDPRHVHRSISDIAFFYGFRNLSHFSRIFKGRFGLSPSEHRRALDRVGH